MKSDIIEYNRTRFLLKSVRIKRIPRSFDVAVWGGQDNIPVDYGSDIMDWHITEYLGDIVQCAYIYKDMVDAMEHVEDFLIELD